MPFIVRRRTPLLAALSASAALAAAPAFAAIASSRATEKLTDTAISGSASAKAGSVTFTVKNSSAMDHSFIVIKTNRKAANLPTNADGTASEKGRVGRIADIPGGKTKTLTLKLAKGHYALICNVGTHYSMGMHKDFTVK